MIVTVTLNPAIDKTIIIETNTNSNVIDSFKQAAGKGVNVSTIINELGYNSIAATILAGKNGMYIDSELQKKKIQHIPVWVEGNTRENRKIITQSNASVTELNGDGPVTTIEEVNNLAKRILDTIDEPSIIVFSGSIPPGLPDTTYKDLIKVFNIKGHTTILDTSGVLLEQGIKAKPYMIKPNIDEISMYAGKEIYTVDEAKPYIEKILNNGVKEVILTMGDKGSVYFSKEEIIQILPFDIKAVNTVGAGDSFVAGYAIALEKGFSVEDRMIYANAVATCSVLGIGTGANNFNQLEDFIKQTKIKR